MILKLKKEGFSNRKVVLYKKGIKKEISIDNQQGNLFSEKEILDIRLQEKNILKDDLELFSDLISAGSSERVVIISSLNKKIKTSSWFKKISKNIQLLELSPIYSNQSKFKFNLKINKIEGNDVMNNITRSQIKKYENISTELYII